MGLWGLILATFVHALPASAESSEPSRDSYFGLLIENDYPKLSIFGLDRNYTSGLSAFAVFPSETKSSVSFLYDVEKALSLASDDEPVRSYEVFSLSQWIFTPDNILTDKLQPMDRPYGGFLFLLWSLQLQRPNDLQSFGIQGGFTGKLSFAEPAQKFWHGIFKLRYPEGWDHQLPTELGVNLLYEHKHRLLPLGAPSERFFDLVPMAQGSLGTIQTLVSVGARMRLGFGLSDGFGPGSLYPIPSLGLQDYDKSSNPIFEIWAFAGGATRWVIWDYFLDGSFISSTPSVHKKPLVSSWEAGLYLRYGTFFGTWRFCEETAGFEEENGRRQHYGVVLLGTRFH